jgi:hypothetical protein
MDVLKDDATSQAIYSARAAAGNPVLQKKGNQVNNCVL